MSASAPQRPARVLQSHGVRPLPLNPRARERRRARKIATAEPKTEPSSVRPSTSSPAQPRPLVLTESSLTPSPFHGTSTDNTQDWLQYFQQYVLFKQLPESAALVLFALLMRGTANVRYHKTQKYGGIHCRTQFQKKLSAQRARKGNYVACYLMYDMSANKLLLLL